VALVGSLAYAGYIYFSTLADKNYQPDPFLIYIVLAAWTLLPPIYLWFDWEFVCKDIPPKDREKAEGRVTHTHELVRNVWLALVIVLAYAFKVKWPF